MKKQLSRRAFLQSAGTAATLFVAPGILSASAQADGKTNVLLITMDDMDCESIGAFGSKVPGTTPNIDRLASEGLRFEHAHVTVAVCQPCRGVLATGRYPHHSGIWGFNHITTDVPLIMERMSEAGFKTGILGKVGHSTPKVTCEWDMVHDQNELGYGRDPAKYYEYAKQFFSDCKRDQKPFYFMANSHDPHRPFANSDQEPQAWKTPPNKVTQPSRVFKPEEVKVPGFLPDLPQVRLEISEYYSSVRRADDTVGAILRALKESGQEENTLVMFLSDNGMSLPFAKTNCYLHSTRTPWIVRWPGKVKPGTIDKENLISGIDFMPTVLDALGLEQSPEVDGSSFLPLLRGEKQDGRTMVFTQFHETSGKKRFPMRCVQNKRYGYIFNPWSDQKTVFKNESQSGRTFKAMVTAAPGNPEVAARMKLFQYREVEEFFDMQNDPDALHNLIDDPSHQKDVDQMRKEMRAWMERVKDPALNAFDNRKDPEKLAEFMAQQNADAQILKNQNLKANNAGRKKNAQKKRAR